MLKRNEIVKEKYGVENAFQSEKIKEKINAIMAGGYDICFIVANKNDLLLVHNPSEGNDISSMCPSLVVLTATSNSQLFGEKAKFYGISNIGKRSAKFLRLLDELITKPLSHFN